MKLVLEILLMSEYIFGIFDFEGRIEEPDRLIRNLGESSEKVGIDKRELICN